MSVLHRSGSCWKWPYPKDMIYYHKTDVGLISPLIFAAFIPLTSIPRLCNTIFIPLGVLSGNVHFPPTNHPSRLAVSLLDITSIESIVINFLMAWCVIK